MFQNVHHGNDIDLFVQQDIHKIHLLRGKSQCLNPRYGVRTRIQADGMKAEICRSHD